MTVYLLVVSGLLLTFGRLGDLRGHKPIYLAASSIFVASSALCGLAPSGRLRWSAAAASRPWARRCCSPTRPPS